MRILVVSDTHSQCEKVYKIYKKLVSEAPIDMIVHCGDYLKDALEIKARLAVPVCAVKGNCDGSYEDDFAILETEAGNFLITHGHMDYVQYDQERLYERVIENDCIGAFYGHTHRAAYTSLSDILLMNPGSLTKPRDNSSGTFGLVITEEDSVWGKIYDYKDFMAEDCNNANDVINSNSNDNGNSKPKVRSGKLREMLNYSDRF